MFWLWQRAFNRAKGEPLRPDCESCAQVSLIEAPTEAVPAVLAV